MCVANKILISFLIFEFSFTETERKLKANDAAYNASFRYAVS